MNEYILIVLDTDNHEDFRVTFTSFAEAEYMRNHYVNKGINAYITAKERNDTL